MDSQTPSGIPYLAYLSGLNLGQGGQSGVTDPSLSGQPAQGNGIGGAAGGLGLDELSQLLAAQQSADTASLGTSQSLLSGISGLGGFGNLGQGGGGYYQAGGTQGGPQQQGAGAGIAGGTGGGVDPMAVLKQALGLVQKGAGLVPGQQGSYGTAGDTGVSLSDQLRSGQSGIASPTVDQLGQSLLSANTLSDTLRSIPEGTATVGQPQITGYGTIGAGGTTGGAIPFGTFDTSKLEQGLGLPSGSLANFSPDEISQIMGGNLTPDQLQQVLGVGETGAGYASPGQLSNLSGGGGYQSSTAATSPTNISGALQGGVGSVLGLLNLIQGIQSGNTSGSIGGGLQGVGGLAQILNSAPELAQALGITPAMLGTLGPLLGGAGGLLGLASGAQGLASGSPGQIGAALPQLAGGGLATYQALQSLLGQGGGALSSGLGGLGTAGLGAIYGLIGSGDPTGGGNVAGSLSGLATTLSAASQGASSLAPLAGAVAGPLGAAAPLVAALIAYFGNAEEKAARESGWANNPIAGGLNEAATTGVGQSLGLLDQLQQGGGLHGATTEQLMQGLPGLVNNLWPYFSTAQGPKGPIRASDALTGMFGRPGLGGTEQYTANENRAQQGVMDTVNELLGRGVSYEQLGQLPVTNAFSDLTMDMYNPLKDLYASNASQYNAAAQPLLESVAAPNRQMLDPQEAMHMAAEGLNPATFGYTQDASGNWYSQPRIPTGNPNGDYFATQPGQLTPDLLFNAAQGSGYFGAPDKATHTGNLTSAMYGGPLWGAIARMSNPTWGTPAQGSLQSLIAQHFNPWAAIGGYDPQQLQTLLQPILQSMQGGGGVIPGIGIGGEGVGSAPAGDGVSSGAW